MTLAELLATPPYNTMTDAEAAAAINAATVQSWQDVSWLDLAVWTHTQGLLRATLETAATSGTDANQTAAQHILDCINAGQPLSASDSRVRALINASSLSAADKTALTALAQIDVPLLSTISDWPHSTITAGNVAEARV